MELFSRVIFSATCSRAWYCRSIAACRWLYLPPKNNTASANSAVNEKARIQNQGESTENGVTVSVTVEGNTLQGEIDEIGAGEEATVSIPLTPAPKGEVTLEVKAEPVPGEHLTENNEATYTLVVE